MKCHRLIVRLAGLALAAFPLAPRAAAGEQPQEPPRPKRFYVHTIQLRDASREPIGPDSTAPYSPRQTCSAPECHDVDAMSRGMHFDMGKSVLSDDWGKARGEPWQLSPGMVGGFLPSFRRQYAPKKNQSAADIDMTAYGFVKACGQCHPGGGAMETDRDGQRYDRRQKAQPALAESLDGDYHGAKWDRSGVVEIDCLLCHAQWPYNNDERIAQLQAENYQFAATAAAGFGAVASKVSEMKAGPAEDLPPDMQESDAGPAAPTVRYDKRLFDARGYVTLDIGPPKDRSCLFCHRFPGPKTPVGWEQLHWRDVHSAQGLACVACHDGGADHNFDLGRPLDWAPAASGSAAMSCEACHEAGHFGAPRPRHAGFPRLHFDKIACVACHAGPVLGERAWSPDPVLTDAPASTPVTAGFETAYPDQQAPWQVVFEPCDGAIRPFDCQMPMWWGNRVDEKTVWPLFPREIAPAMKAAAAEIRDDNGDGVPEVNRNSEIIAVDAALRKVLAGGRFKEVRPVYVKGQHLQWVENGQVLGSEEELSPMLVAMGHVVLPPQQALGARGCTECHSPSTHFFGGDRIVNPINSENNVKSHPMRRWMGVEDRAVRLGWFREAVVKPYGLWLVPLAGLACLLHYVVFGPKRVPNDDPAKEIARFAPLERVSHLVQMLAFLVLVATGVGFLLTAAWRDALPAVWSARGVETLHAVTGYVFIAASLTLIVRWVPHGVFRAYDVQWLDLMGGYLWRKGKAPAGKFNAGQKVYFWIAAVAGLALAASGVLMALQPEGSGLLLAYAYTLHDLMAVLILPAVVGHVYFGLLCNPGTARAIFHGTVTRAWAEEHHPNWLEELNKSGPKE